MNDWLIDDPEDVAPTLPRRLDHGLGAAAVSTRPPALEPGPSRRYGWLMAIGGLGVALTCATHAEALAGAQVVVTTRPVAAAKVGLARPVTAPVQGLCIRGEAPGVRVLVDGVDHTAEAFVLVALAPGRHVVRLEAEHYEPVELAVDIRRGHTESLGPLMLRQCAPRLTLEMRQGGGTVQVVSGRRRVAKITGVGSHDVALGTYLVDVFALV